ncbi:MAG TPA: M56 family metallopeptidase [Verrucomicrobiae bacterium]|nr:M56 family metallopeptidase [Verrucomicrobiae bacterium]
MKPLIQFLNSGTCALLIETLLHTLWQAGVVALAMAFALRHCASPAVRYRLSVAALVLVLSSAIMTWAAVQPEVITSPVSLATKSAVAADFNAFGDSPSSIAASGTVQLPASVPWSAWLLPGWLCGALLMLVRAGLQVAGADRLRRSSSMATLPELDQLVQRARSALGITCQVRVRITKGLASPAVMGIFVPTLILPLSLVTTLSHEQLRFILLHELTHIRRGDYLANLFQLFTEALLFFNPAVWWISQQIRCEREVCCDAMAIQLGGAPVEYVRTLVHVAESTLRPGAAAPAFACLSRQSRLADRIQRLLVPGYRPALRLTWRAILAGVLVSVVMLLLSAGGARIGVASVRSGHASRHSEATPQTVVAASPPVIAARHSVEPIEVISDQAVLNLETGVLHVHGNVTVSSGTATIQSAEPALFENGQGSAEPSHEHISSESAVAQPQLTLRAQFASVADSVARDFIRGFFGPGTSLEGAVVGILSARDLGQARRMLRANTAETMSELSVTTLPGRQASIQSLDIHKMRTGINPAARIAPGVSTRNGTNDALLVTDIELGYFLDIASDLGPVSNTVSLNLSATGKKILENQQEEVTAYIDGSRARLSISKPKIAVRQLTGKAVIWDGQTVVLTSAQPAPGAPAERLIVLVTATLIDAAGRRLNSDKDAD